MQYGDRAVVYGVAGDGTRRGEKEAPVAAQLGAGGYEAVFAPTSHRTYAYGTQGGLETVTELAGPQAGPVVTYQLDGVGRPLVETRAGAPAGRDGHGRPEEVE